ncbi:MAG: serine/threonine-protein kinase [Phycisphaerales bacterium]|nr:serine/threonine-protein kinase [Phycisphaerales bacterium]
MNNDSFKQVEILFHELNQLHNDELTLRLESLIKSDPSKGMILKSMFDSLSHAPNFLNTSSLEAQIPQYIELALDGSSKIGDRYTLVERIGIGGSSSVFRANATNPEREVAVKMLRFGLVSNEMKDRFEIESQALASLTHPHIAHVYQTGVYTIGEVQVPWIAMEYISGSQTIVEYANSMNLSFDARVDLFSKVCNAIQAAHQAGILHLDLNASNILIDPHGFPKIIDFGLFGILHCSSNSSPTFVGTRTSMAPEQTLFQDGSFDERTDVYALGLLLAELLTGIQLQAFPNTTTQQSCQFIAIGKARELLKEIESLPNHYKLLIDSMICVDPDERLQYVTEVLSFIADSQNIPKASFDKRFILLAVGACLITILFLIYSPTSNTPHPSILNEPETLSIPQQVAIDISSQNPRSSKYSESQTNVINSLSNAIETDLKLTPIERANMHASLADHERIAGNYDSSIEHYKQAARLFESIGSDDEFNWVMLGLAQTLLFLERIDQAQSTLAQLNRTIPLTPIFLVDLSIAESNTLIALGLFDNAASQIQYTTTLIESITESQNLEKIERLLELNNLFNAVGQRSNARESLLEARKISSVVFNPTGIEVAMIDLKIGMNLARNADSSEFDKAIEMIENAINQLQTNDDLFHVAWGYRQLGNIYFNHEQVDEAIQSHLIASSKMISILGENHHESRICNAQLMISQYAKGDSSSVLVEEFILNMESLAEILGMNHSVVQSLYSDWAQLHLQGDT